MDHRLEDKIMHTNIVDAVMHSIDGTVQTDGRFEDAGNHMWQKARGLYNHARGIPTEPSNSYSGEENGHEHHGHPYCVTPGLVFSAWRLHVPDGVAPLAARVPPRVPPSMD